MDKNLNGRGTWLNLLALLFSLFGVIVSISGALSTYYGQASIADNPLWPLPGLVLSYWSALGLAGFMVVGITSRQMSPGWLQAAWTITGAFIPLIIIGGFSIGTMVLIAFLLFLIPTLLLALRIRSNWLKYLAYFGLGAVGSLVVVLILINLGNASV